MRKLITNLIGFASLVLFVVAIYMAFVYAPLEVSMGPVQKIFYFHVAFAWTSFIAFFVTFAASCAYLATRTRFWDTVAASSVELGVAFSCIILTTGPIWARPVWGAYWTWDPRLVTTLILLFIYSAYLMLRGAIDEESKRARYSAVLGIIGFLDVPIVYFSVNWWSRTIHPDVIKPEGAALHPHMLQSLYVALIAVTLFYFFVLFRRIRLEELKDEVRELRKLILKEF